MAHLLHDKVTELNEDISLWTVKPILFVMQYNYLTWRSATEAYIAWHIKCSFFLTPAVLISVFCVRPC